MVPQTRFLPFFQIWAKIVENPLKMTFFTELYTMFKIVSPVEFSLKMDKIRDLRCFGVCKAKKLGGTTTFDFASAWDYCLEKFFEKNANFPIFVNFLTKFLLCFVLHGGLFYLFLDSTKPGEHFLYTHDAPSTSRSKGRSAAKIKILGKKCFFQKNRNFQFLRKIFHFFYGFCYSWQNVILLSYENYQGIKKVLKRSNFSKYLLSWTNFWFFKRLRSKNAIVLKTFLKKNLSLSVSGDFMGSLSVSI